MMFTSSTLNEQSMYHIAMMLHLSLRWKDCSMLDRYCGLDLPDIPIPTIIPFPVPFWNGLICY